MRTLFTLAALLVTLHSPPRLASAQAILATAPSVVYARGMSGAGYATVQVQVDENLVVEFSEAKCYDKNDESIVPKNFPNPLTALPPKEIYDGVFTESHVEVEEEEEEESCEGGGKTSFKIPGMPAYIHDHVVTEEEARAIVEASKTWEDDYLRPGQFSVTHVNLSIVPLAPGTPSMKERMARLMGADPNTIPDVVPFKKIIGAQKGLKNHIDNGGFTEGTVILYFQTVQTGALAFPYFKTAILPRAGRAVAFTSRTANGTVDFRAVHHTMEYDEAPQNGDHRLSLAFAVKILGGADGEWFDAPHEVTKTRPAGWCHGIGSYCVPGFPCRDLGIPNTTVGNNNDCNQVASYPSNCTAPSSGVNGTCDGLGNCVATSQVNCFKDGRDREGCDKRGAAHCRFISRNDKAVKKLIKGMTPKKKRDCVRNWLGCRPQTGLPGSCFFSCKEVCQANQCQWKDGEGCSMP